MKTTLKKRLLRLGILIGTVMGLAMLIVSLVGLGFVCTTNDQKLSNYVVKTASGTLEEEIIFLSDTLDAETLGAESATFNRLESLDTYKNGNYSEFIDAINAAGGATVISKEYNGEYLIGKSGTSLVGVLDYDYFNAIIGALHEREGDYGFITDASGNVVLSTKQELSGSTLGSIESGSRSDPLFGGSMNVTATPCGETGYYVIYAVPNTNIILDILLVGAILMVVYVGLTIGTVFVSRAVSKKIVKSIMPTINTLKALSNGTLTTDLEVNNRGDETEVLAVAMSETSNELSKYIGDISRITEELSQGNLDIDSDAEYRGDFVKIKQSLLELKEALRSIIGSLGSMGKRVNQNANTLQTSAENLADQSTREAATIEELNATMETVKGDVVNTATMTGTAKSVLDDATESLNDGNRSMKEALDVMAEIQERSEGISQVIKIVEGIAFQTNILALNATVEAARAGEAGKGFAVVADEVRNLANKSAAAARETAANIEESLRAINKGSDVVRETSERMTKLSVGVNSLNEIIDSINVAAQAEESAIIQIAIGLGQITETVQNNTATSEEIAAGSTELLNEAEKLHGELSRFIITDSTKTETEETTDTEQYEEE